MPINVQGATANCANSTLGKEACKRLIASLSEPHGSDLIIINCQETALQDAILELTHHAKAIDIIGITHSSLRVTRTKFEWKVIFGYTGIATIALFNKNKIQSLIFDKNALRNTQGGKNSNKGATINTLILTDIEGNVFNIQTISAHLDSYFDNERILNWRGIKTGIAYNCESWDQMVSSVHHLQIAGYDANTRNLWDQEAGMINMWHQEKLDSRIAPLFLAPLGDQLYSADDTYKCSDTKIIEADNNRTGFANAGSLDFIAVLNNTADRSVIQPQPKRFLDSPINIPTESNTARDHDILLSEVFRLQPISDFERIRHYIAAQLIHAAPLISKEIYTLVDTIRNRELLIGVYKDYLGLEGKLINKIHYEPDISNVSPWFEMDRLADENGDTLFSEPGLYQAPQAVKPLINTTSYNPNGFFMLELKTPTIEQAKNESLLSCPA